MKILSLYVSVCVYICVCVYERERHTHTETQRQKGIAGLFAGQKGTYVSYIMKGEQGRN